MFERGCVCVCGVRACVRLFGIYVCVGEDVGCVGEFVDVCVCVCVCVRVCVRVCGFMRGGWIGLCHQLGSPIPLTHRCPSRLSRQFPQHGAEEKWQCVGHG